MSKIFDLIKRLCPDGVEFRELGDEVNPLTILKRGRVIAKTDLDKKVGNYPVYSSQTINGGEIGKIDTFDFDGEFVTWTTDGANAGTVFYRNGKFSITNVCGLIEIKDTSKLNYKFLFYWLSIEAKKHVHSGMGNAKLMSHQMAKIKLPVPPLEVQREIVRILDCFTLLTAELTAELTARKKQYEFYRDHLLSFDELNKNGGYELKTLGSIADYSSDRIKFDSLNELNYVGVENLLQDKAGKVSSKYVPASGNCTKFESGDILVGNIRPYLKKIWQADCTGGASGDVLVLRLNDESVNSRYLYQILADDKFFDYNMKNAKGAKMPRGNKNAILEYKIPVPSLPTQRKIVEILDKFDTLVNSIAEGLPCEIELRQKQYEYYRERLLSFTEIKKEI